MTTTPELREKRMMPADWSALPSIAPSHIKVARTGLGASDRIDLEKLVGSSSMPLIKSALTLLQPHELPIFSIGLGCTEKYGFNRNFDAFGAPACRKYHDTFVKHGRWFRDHDNKPTSLHYGRHILTSFNEKMGRVEIVTGLYQNKEAAERNGSTGRVADMELNSIESGDPIHTSMSCKIPYDVCVSCHHKAASPKDYCDEKTCKHGGCKNNLGRLYDDGLLQGVDNPIVTWFDLSNITNKKQADRIAVTYGAIKQAAAQIQVPERFKKAFMLLLEEEQRMVLAPEPITSIERLSAKVASTTNISNLGYFVPLHAQPGGSNDSFGAFLYSTKNAEYAAEIFNAAAGCLSAGRGAATNGVPLRETTLKKAVFSVLLSDTQEKYARVFSGPPPAAYAGYTLACVAASEDPAHTAAIVTRINSCNKA